jgi:hypothetical protein
MQTTILKTTMEGMTGTPCRSYRGQEFDGCPACLDAALDAVAQAGLYVLGQTAPQILGRFDGLIDVGYGLQIRLFAADGTALASDALEIEQLIRATVVEADDDPVPEDGPASSSPEDEDRPGMKLEDFQTVLDRIELAPGKPGCVQGTLAGLLLGFDRQIGRFDILVAPAAPVPLRALQNGRRQQIRPAHSS